MSRIQDFYNLPSSLSSDPATAAPYCELWQPAQVDVRRSSVDEGQLTFASSKRTRWGSFKTLEEQEPTTEATDDVIDRLYTRVANLLHSNADRQKIQSAYDELRTAQREEADRIATLLEAQLDMAMDAGKTALATVDSLISQYEDTTPENSSTKPPDRS